MKRQKQVGGCGRNLLRNLKGGVPWPKSISTAAHLALKKEMMIKKLLFGVLFASTAFGANSASALNYPASVVGNWSVLGNQSAGTLSITTQGAAGGYVSITGTIYGNNPIQGFYCPSSGRIHFLRKLAGTNTAFQA